MKKIFTAVIALSLVLIPLSILAGVGITATWSGGGADDNWSTNINWAPPAPPPADCDVVFPAGANRLSNVNDLAAGTAFATVTFNGAGGGYNLSGNSFGINEELVAANTADDNTIGNDLFLGELPCLHIHNCRDKSDLGGKPGFKRHDAYNRRCRQYRNIGSD